MTDEWRPGRDDRAERTTVSEDEPPRARASRAAEAAGRGAEAAHAARAGCTQGGRRRVGQSVTTSSGERAAQAQRNDAHGFGEHRSDAQARVAPARPGLGEVWRWF